MRQILIPFLFLSFCCIQLPCFAAGVCGPNGQRTTKSSNGAVIHSGLDKGSDRLDAQQIVKAVPKAVVPDEPPQNEAYDEVSDNSFGDQSSDRPAFQPTQRVIPNNVAYEKPADENVAAEDMPYVIRRSAPSVAASPTLPIEHFEFDSDATVSHSPSPFVLEERPSVSSSSRWSQFVLPAAISGAAIGAGAVSATCCPDKNEPSLSGDPIDPVDPNLPLSFLLEGTVGGDHLDGEITFEVRFPDNTVLDTLMFQSIQTLVPFSAVSNSTTNYVSGDIFTVVVTAISGEASITQISLLVNGVPQPPPAGPVFAPSVGDTFSFVAP